jgi:prepilin-type processing-associated H-X9-DG protein/prepilin-type N-terminal cleavage/methylation domain-containing protein
MESSVFAGMMAMTMHRYRRGLTLVETLVVIAIIGVLLGIILAAVQLARGAAARLSCANKLRQIGLALHQYHNTHSCLPPGVSHPELGSWVYPRPYGADRDPYPLLNWQARILPFVEQEALWAQIQEAYRLDRQLLEIPPHTASASPVPLFLCAADQPRTRSDPSLANSPGEASYIGVSGTNDSRRNGLLFLDSQVRFGDVSDGTSQTLLVGERPPSFVGAPRGRWHGGWGAWGSADAYLGVREEIGADKLGCSIGPYHFQVGRRDDPCAVYHYWSFHNGGANFLFADGSVRFTSYSVDHLLPNLATRAGGETASLLE